MQIQQGNRRYQTSPAVCNRTLNSIYFFNLSPINAKLTLLSYVNASIYSCFSTNVDHYHSNNSNGQSATFILGILPINRQISPFPSYSSLRVILKQLVQIIPFNNKKLNYVQRYGK